MSAESPFTVSTDIQLRFRDTDAMRHVNNAVYLSYLELGRQDYWRKSAGLRDFGKVDIILARVEIDYRAPATLDMEPVLRTRVSELRRSSFLMEYRLEDKRSGTLLAEAKTVLACYDYDAGKVKRVPDEFRERVLKLEKPGTVKS